MWTGGLTGASKPNVIHYTERRLGHQLLEASGHTAQLTEMVLLPGSRSDWAVGRD